MNRNLIAFAIVAMCTAACSNSAEKKINSVKLTNIYDIVEKKNMALLDSLGLSEYCTAAKWLLYTLQYDDTAVNNEGKLFPLSSLDIKVGLVEKVNDTLSILFFYMENDSTVINRQLKTGKYIIDGIEFKTSENKVIAYISGESKFTMSEPDTRFQKPLKPEVVTYIKVNRENINTWFRNEAIRKKIVK